MSKWRCVSRPDNESKNFTVGKVYELDDMTDELTGDSGYRYGTKHVHADCGGTIAFLQGCKIMFEEVKDMFNMNKVKNGMLVKLRNGKIAVVMRDMYNGDDRLITLEDDDSDSVQLCYYNNSDMTLHMYGDNDSDWDIMEVCEPVFYPNLSNYDEAFCGLNNNNVIWKREQPKELTVGQIEKILGYKIKVVADKER